MLSVDVYVDAAQQRAFRRRAIAAFKDNKEYMEVLFIRRAVGEFHIQEFRPVKVLSAGPYRLEPDPDDYQRLLDEAEYMGLEFGSLHTHIIGDASPSEADHQSGADYREALMGICYISEEKGKAKSRIEFWQPQRPAKLHIISNR